jgi:hypothetical protein
MLLFVSMSSCAAERIIEETITDKVKKQTVED